MPCYESTLEDGSPVILCGALGPHCKHCRDVATKLCDYPVGPRGRTCSAPLCDTHARAVGIEIDYCAGHHDLWLLAGRPVP